MNSLPPSLSTQLLAPDERFLHQCAEQVLAFLGRTSGERDFSHASLLIPNLKLVPAFNQSLFQQAGGAVLLPRIDTLSGMVSPWVESLAALPDSRRQLILHALLRGREGFEENILWDMVAELVALFDQLTEHESPLPLNEDDLLARLELAFQLKSSATLAYEARLVCALWRAEAEGLPSRTAARLIATAQWLAQLDGPLLVIAESTELGGLEKLVQSAAERVPVLLLKPARSLASSAFSQFLLHVWPVEDGSVSLHDRVSAIQADCAQSAQGRLRLVAADSFEDLGHAVAQQVLSWIREGRRSIALIAADRLAARRARALLEREQVLVQDETGWKMSTTRVAATVDAWLEFLASDAWHRAVIDLLRTPLIFADVDPLLRAQATDAIARVIAQENILSGLDRLLAQPFEQAEAGRLLQRLHDARTAMGLRQNLSIAEWLRRLHAALQTLGALPHFEADPVGREWLDWHAQRLAELSDESARFSFSSWRAWFNRQMDAQLYRDESVDSPVILTHLAASRLRRFDAAIVIGADAEHLSAPRQPAWLAHAGVRRELGLPGFEQSRRQLREDLAGLLLASDSCVIAWQSSRADESVQPATDVALLMAAMSVDKPVRAAQVRAEASAAAFPSAPALPPERLPSFLSASSMQTLVDCPYRFFARHVLRLGEADDLSEGMEKRDFGEQLHAILARFHAQCSPFAEQTDESLLAALEAITEAAFREAVNHNFHDHAWRLRWRSRLPAYIAWQRERERAGWQWLAGEEWVEREHEFARGHSLTLRGRIDRLDQNTQGSGENAQIAVLDYKSRSRVALQKQVKDPDDVQLAFYTLLRGTRIAEAAYVALDDESPTAVTLAEPEERAGALHDCISESFSAMLGGQGLPAHGAPSACLFCEMGGLCRKAWQG